MASSGVTVQRAPRSWEAQLNSCPDCCTTITCRAESSAASTGSWSAASSLTTRSENPASAPVVTVRSSLTNGRAGSPWAGAPASLAAGTPPSPKSERWQEAVLGSHA